MAKLAKLMLPTRRTLCGVCCLVLMVACGNDKQVEEDFVNVMHQAIQVMKNANSVDDITKAQEIRKKAYALEGADRIMPKGEALEVIEEFELVQDSAQKKVMQRIVDQGVVPLDDNSMENSETTYDESDTLDILLE